MTGLVGDTDRRNDGQEALTDTFGRAHDGPQSPAYSELSTAMGRLAAGNDIIFLADTDHNDGSLKKPLTDPAFLGSAKAAGVTDVYIELPVELQGDLDALTSGEMSREVFTDRATAAHIDEYNTQFPAEKEDHEGGGIIGRDAISEMRRRMGENADIALAVTRAGMKIHAADAQPITESVEISHYNLTEEYGALYEKFRERVQVYDPVVAENINATRQGKAMVAFGAAHLENTELGNFKKGLNNMDEMLERGGAKTATMVMTGEAPEAFRQRLAELQRVLPNEYETPQYIYNPATNTGITPALDVSAPAAPAPLQKNTL